MGERCADYQVRSGIRPPPHACANEAGMFRSISAIAALLFAAAILYAGNGLQSTLLSVRGDIEGFPTTIIGLLASAYHAGFILGCRLVPGMIQGVGHIRAFVALASIASSSALAHILFVEPIA